MARFDDYHRTVVGYHGTGLAAALRIVNRIENFHWSERDFDWLGGGIYFWEYAPKQALTFAETRLCVRNPASILGTWLHYPTGLEVNDVCRALQTGPFFIEPENQGREGISEPDVEIQED